MMSFHLQNKLFQASDETYKFQTLHGFHLTPKIFAGVQVRTVPQSPWERMNAIILNYNGKICDELISRNATNLCITLMAISEKSNIFLLLAISKRIEL